MNKQLLLKFCRNSLKLAITTLIYTLANASMKKATKSTVETGAQLLQQMKKQLH